MLVTLETSIPASFRICARLNPSRTSTVLVSLKVLSVPDETNSTAVEPPTASSTIRSLISGISMHPPFASPRASPRARTWVGTRSFFIVRMVDASSVTEAQADRQAVDGGHIGFGMNQDERQLGLHAGGQVEV